jgi:parallel beta-helix repeat protein
LEFRAVSGIMLALLALSTITMAFDIQQVEASGTIYIRADGSIDPPTAPIRREDDLYTFTGDIYDQIVVQRNNIIIDGNRYTVQGSGGTGVLLSGMNNVTIKYANIKDFDEGIMLDFSSGNIISGNNITANTTMASGSSLLQTTKFFITTSLATHIKYIVMNRRIGGMMVIPRAETIGATMLVWTCFGGFIRIWLVVMD